MTALTALTALSEYETKTKHDLSEFMQVGFCTFILFRYEPESPATDCLYLLFAQ